jgi:transcriptional regulator with XRE-family HTH domain
MTERSQTKVQKLFGARIRRIRIQKGISQEALALTSGLDRSYVGGVERGERNISLVNIHKIARALGVPAKELF